MHEGKLLVVRHTPTAGFWALPGGHLEEGEGIEECLKREIEEELGIRPEISHLLYVHTFKQSGESQTVECIFGIKNGSDFLKFEELARSHAYELADAEWVMSTDDRRILPEQVAEDFRRGVIGSQDIRVISEIP